jgi:hypothetical protein
MWYMDNDTGRPVFPINTPLIVEYYTAPSALLQSGGEIRLYTTHVKNSGSTIEGAGNIYHGNP